MAVRNKGLARPEDVQRLAQAEAHIHQLELMLVELHEINHQGTQKGSTRAKEMLVTARKEYAVDFLRIYGAPPPTGSSLKKAQEVFNTPELLEHILLMLGPLDVLRAQSTVQAFDALVRTSHSLQRHLSLRPDPGAFRLSAQTCSQDSPIRCIITHQNRCSLDLLEKYYPDLPAEQREKMRPTTIVIDISFCGQGDGFTQDVWTITSDTGITFGDCLRQYQAIVQAHLYCPLAVPLYHTENGLFYAEPAFTGLLQLRPDDPYLKNREREHAHSQMELKHLDAQRTLMQRYCGAKRTAHVAGTAIPTLQEFKTAHPEMVPEELSSGDAD